MLKVLAIVVLSAVVLFGIAAMVGTFTGIVPVAITIEGGHPVEIYLLWAGLASFLIVWPLAGIVRLVVASERVKQLFFTMGVLSSVLCAVAVVALVVLGMFI